MSSEKPASILSEKPAKKTNKKTRICYSISDKSAAVIIPLIQVQSRVKMNGQAALDCTFISQCVVDSRFKAKYIADA